MATSLAAQLNKLAVPQTSLLLRDKKRPSLLFDPKEAAAIDRSTFYEIGIRGLRDLIALNGDFIIFENNLFSSTSQNIERSVHDKHTNEKLNKSIKKFLMMLSPYFLLKSAHKALEWLIQRFMIQDYNRDDFLKLILPYHETNIFIRCLQLFNFYDTGSAWHWLRPVQKAQIQLNKLTLYNHAASDIGFLKFLSKTVFDMVYENKSKPNSLTTFFTYYCTTTIGVLLHTEELTEPQLTAILPPLLKGLLSDIPDYVASTYMITAQLLKKTKLSAKLLHSLVQRISSDQQPHLRTEATLLLVVLYQAQSDNFQAINAESLVNLTRGNDWFATNLGKLAADGSHVLPLLQPVLRAALKKIKFDLYRRFVEKIFAEVRVDDAGTEILIKLALDSCVSESNEDEDVDEEEAERPSDVPVTEWYASFLKRLETQFPNAFDRVFSQIMASESAAATTKHQLRALKSLLNVMLASQNQQTVFERLYHPNDAFRLKAVQHLVQNLHQLSDKDRELFVGAINDRLLDNEHRIVGTILSLATSDLLLLLGENNFYGQICPKLLTKSFRNRSDPNWSSDVTKRLLTHVCSSPSDFSQQPNAKQLLLLLMPFLFPVDRKHRDVALQILNSPLAEVYEFLAKARDLVRRDAPVEHVCNHMYTSLLKYPIDGGGKVISCFNTLPHKLEIYKYFTMLLATATTQPEVADDFKLLQFVARHLRNASFCKIKPGPSAVHAFVSEMCTKNKLPLQAALQLLEIIVSKRFPRWRNDALKVREFVDLTAPSVAVRSLVLVVKTLVNGSSETEATAAVNCYAELLKTVLDKCSGSLAGKINLLVIFLTVDASTTCNVDVRTQLRIVRVINSLLGGIRSPLNVDDVIVPCALIALVHPAAEVRACTVEMLEHVVRLSNVYKPLLTEILNHREEILLDANQLPLILCTISAMRPQIKKCCDSLITLAGDDAKTPPHIGAALLNVFTFVNSFEIFDRTSERALRAMKTTSSGGSMNIHDLSIVHNVLLRLSDETCKEITLKSTAWQLISCCLKQDKSCIQTTVTQTSPSVIVLEQISRDTFENLRPSIRAELLKMFVELATNSNHPAVVQNVYKLVKKIELDAEMAVRYLKAMIDVKSKKITNEQQQQQQQKKFRRVSNVPTIDILDTDEWKHGVTVLEFIQDKKKLTNAKSLLPVLFNVLKKCLDFDEQAAVEYPKQTVLSAILHICQKLDADRVPLPKNVFNMELVVQCIRASQNPQTHHHALLVLAYTASLIPEQVLHNIMAIFTFMGSSVLRHDDAYSFQIIAKVIDTIVPILVKSSSDEKEANVAQVLRVFVDVILDVPEHRRMPLFQKLLTTLGLNEYLWLFLVLVFEAHIIHGSEETQKQKDPKNRLLAEAEAIPKRLDVATTITLEFGPEIVLATCVKLLDYVKSLPVEKSDNLTTNTAGTVTTFNIKQHTAKQFRHYKYTAVTFLSNLLSSKQLVNTLAILNNNDSLALEPLYKNLIINVLTYIQSVSKTMDRMAGTPQAPYWKVMLHHCYDIMDSVNALLTREMFLLVVRGLIVHNLPTVRRKAMEILNTKLQHQPSFFCVDPSNEEVTNDDDLLALIPSLIGIVKNVDDTSESVAAQTEDELIQQTALLSLKLLIKMLAARHPDKFCSILDFVTDLLRGNRVHGNILASVVLCLAELCHKLRAHAIPGLGRYMPAVIKILKAQKHQDAPDLLLLCVITAIQKIVESLPLFLSPYLEKLLVEICILSGKWRRTSNANPVDPKVAPFVKKLETIGSNVGTVIPSRILLPTLTHTYANLIGNRQFDAVAALMNVLNEHLTYLRGPDLTSHLPELTGLFLTALQFRTEFTSKRLDDDASIIITTVEDCTIRTLTTLVLKLSETSFRPIYYKLFDWAVRNETKNERIITFYRLSCGIAQNLKSLFVLFAGHFVANAAQLLDATNSVKIDDSGEFYFADNIDNNLLLIDSILKTLHAIFLYDTKNFIDKDRFDTLMQPLVDQLENQCGGIKELVQRANDLVIPCIAQFAVAVADDALWKQLNYQILLKTRHNHAQVRLIALNCICEMGKKLGEDFLPFLPETIPFLSELLEDEDEMVEKRCQLVIQDLETVLGEPLQKYF